MAVDNRWSTPRRQSPIAILFILGRVMRMLARQFWIVLLALFTGRGGSTSDRLLYVFFVLAVFSSLSSLISYFRYYFYVQDDELIVNRGLIRRTRINIPLDRIQSIRFKEGPLHQLFGVVELEMDTSGSNDTELELKALKKEDALALRQFLSERSKQLVDQRQTNTAFAAVDAGAAVLFSLDGKSATESKPAEERVLLTLSPLELVKLGMSQNHVRTAVIIFGFLATTWNEIRDLFNRDLEDDVLSVLGFDFSQTWKLFALIIPVFLFAAFLITLFMTVLRYFNLKMTFNGNLYRTESGLFTRQEQAAALRKTQIISWKSNVLQRYFDLWRISIKQASSVEVGRQQALHVPGCHTAEAAAILDIWEPNFHESEPQPQHIHVKYILRRTLYVGIVLALVVFAASLIFSPSKWDVCWLLWIPFQYWLSIKLYQYWQFTIYKEGIKIQQGWLTRSITHLRWFQLQAISIRQSWYEQRHNLATVHLHTAAGSVSIPFLELEAAEALRDAALSRVETSERNWM